jgi:hypothetical protein
VGSTSARSARLSSPARALAGVLVLAAVPLVLCHRLLSDELQSFRWSLAYLATELGPWLLLAAGVAFLLPVALSAGADPDSRLRPRGRASLFVWGVVLYLLGLALAVEAVDVWSYAH